MKVLILTVSFGDGHNAAAANLRGALESLAPDECQVEVLELLDAVYGRLNHLARLFPRARLTGIDASAAMLGVARRRLHAFGDRVKFKHGNYDSAGNLDAPPDLIRLSYCLSMMNPGVEDVIAAVGAASNHGPSIVVARCRGRRLGMTQRGLSGQPTERSADSEVSFRFAEPAASAFFFSDDFAARDADFRFGEPFALPFDFPGFAAVLASAFFKATTVFRQSFFAFRAARRDSLAASLACLSLILASRDLVFAADASSSAFRTTSRSRATFGSSATAAAGFESRFIFVTSSARRWGAEQNRRMSQG